MEPPPPKMDDARLLLAQTLRAADKTSDAPEKVLRYAALSSTFLPEQAMAAAGIDTDAAARPGEQAALVRFSAAARLAEACDAQIWHPLWIMRTAARARQIEIMAEEKAAIVAWRKAQPGFDHDSAAQVICDALLGEGDFAPERVQAALAAFLPVERYEQLIRGISLALPLAPARDLLPALRTALASAEAASDPARKDELLFARPELPRIEALIEAQWKEADAAPLPAIPYVFGGGGVGKSTLLSLIRQSVGARGMIGALLDFERPGVDGRDPLGLSLDLARQVAEQAGAEGGALFLAMQTAQGHLDTSRSNARIVAQGLLGDIADLLDSAGRRLLLSLDSLECLTLRGDEAALLLHDWLRALRAETDRVAILAAGRAALAPDMILAGDMAQIALEGLPDPAAMKLLQNAGIDDAIAGRIVAFAQGNPLMLNLSARAVADGGDAELLTDAGDATGAEQLARRLLARLPSPELRRLAGSALLLRRVSAPLLAHVGLGSLDVAQAMFDQFGQESWLAERQGDWLVPRQDLRTALFEPLIASDPDGAARLFAAAAEWHGANGDPVLALYYRLQAMRRDATAPPIDPNLAPHLTPAMIDELPAAAQDAVAVARGERSHLLRTGEPGAHALLGPQAMAELQMLLDRRAWFEAGTMACRIPDLSPIDPASRDGATMIDALWRGGDMDRAAQMLVARRADASQADDAGLPSAAFADLDPAGFRDDVAAGPDKARLLAARLDRSDDPDWDVPGLLLRAEGIESHRPLVESVWTLWTGPRPDQAALDQLHRTLRAAAARSPDTATATATANRAMLIRLLARDPSHRELLRARLHHLSLTDEAEQAARQIAPILSGLSSEEEAHYIGAFAIDRIDALGGLAFLAATLAWAHDGLHALAVRIARRRATIVGHWSYGQAPEGWQPPSDAEEAAHPAFETHALRALILPLLADEAPTF